MLKICSIFHFTTPLVFYMLVDAGKLTVIVGFKKKKILVVIILV